MQLHIHFNDFPMQICQLKEKLEVGQTATIHVHETPGDCQICPNGHCHATNISISRIDEETVYVALENFMGVLDCDIKTLPFHPIEDH